jgi:hypothetical protein
MDKEKLIKKREEIDKQIKEIEEKEKLKAESSFKKIIFNKKEFRIYKWESRLFGNFKFPEGFRLCNLSDFGELFDEKLIDYPRYLEYEVYFLNHCSIRKQEEGIIVKVLLDKDGDWLSHESGLGDCSEEGRIVVVRDLK